MWQDVLTHSHMPPSFFCSSSSTGGTLWTEPPGEGWPNLSWSRLQLCWSRHYCAAQVCANLCRVIISADSLSKSPVCIFPIFYSSSWILAQEHLIFIFVDCYPILQHITVILGLCLVLHHMLSSLWLLYICEPDKLNGPIHPLVKARSRGPGQEARVPSTTYCPAHLKASGKPALPLALGACQAHRHNQHFWFMLLTIYFLCGPC